jgi:hypothetical protein
MKTSKIALNTLHVVVLLIIGYMLFVAIHLIAFDLPFLIENWINLVDLAPQKLLFLLILNLVFALYFLFPLWSFRMFIKNVQGSQTFTESNIRLLKNFSFGLFIYLLSQILIEVFWRFFTNVADAYGSEVPVRYSFYISVFLLALFIRVITHFISVGVSLKQENDLTI